jgi:hypothetical protein
MSPTPPGPSSLGVDTVMPLYANPVHIGPPACQLLPTHVAHLSGALAKVSNDLAHLTTLVARSASVPAIGSSYALGSTPPSTLDPVSRSATTRVYLPSDHATSVTDAIQRVVLAGSTGCPWPRPHHGHHPVTPCALVDVAAHLAQASMVPSSQASYHKAIANPYLHLRRTYSFTSPTCTKLGMPHRPYIV